MADALLQRLCDIGLGTYEAKLYLALVRRHPATGYELARASGVPSSKVYEVLARLQDKDIVYIADGGGRARCYIPADPEEFVARYTRRMTRALDGLKQDLQSAGNDDPVDYIWNLRGRDTLLERATTLLTSAEDTVLLSGWDAELATLAGAVADAHRRGVRVAVIDYGTLDLEAAAVYAHPIRDTIYNEKGGRGLALCVDSHVALVGLVTGREVASGAWSTNHAFVTATEDYLKHDIYVQKIVGRFNDLLVRTYGRGYARWRDVFSDRVCAPRRRAR